MKKIAVIGFCLLAIYGLSSTSFSLTNGITVNEGQLYTAFGYSRSTVNARNSTTTSVGVGYGITNNLEGRLGICMADISGISANAFIMDMQYDIFRDKASGTNISIDVPVGIMSVLGLSANSAGLAFNFAKEMSQYTPYCYLGFIISSFGSSTSTSYPVSIGITYSPTSKFDIYGELGTSISSSSAPLDISAGIEIKL